MSDLYVNRTNGSIMRVNHVDDSFAYCDVVAPNPSKWAMPIADYDGAMFPAAWRPATPEDLATLTAGPAVRPPRGILLTPDESPEPGDDGEPVDERA